MALHFGNLSLKTLPLPFACCRLRRVVLVWGVGSGIGFGVEHVAGGCRGVVVVVHACIYGPVVFVPSIKDRYLIAASCQQFCKLSNSHEV